MMNKDVPVSCRRRMTLEGLFQGGRRMCSLYCPIVRSVSTNTIATIPKQQIRKEKEATWLADRCIRGGRHTLVDGSQTCTPKILIAMTTDARGGSVSFTEKKVDPKSGTWVIYMCMIK